MDFTPDTWGVTAEHTFIDDEFNPEVGFVRRIIVVFVVYTDDRNIGDPLGRALRLLNRGFVIKVNRLL